MSALVVGVCAQALPMKGHAGVLLADAMAATAGDGDAAQSNGMRDPTSSAAEPLPDTALDRRASSLSIERFGASPTERDNADAIQRAIHAAMHEGRAVLVPRGTYRYGRALHLRGVTIEGEGQDSILAASRRQSMALVVSEQGGGVRNIKITGPAGRRYDPYESCGIAVLHANGFLIENVAILQSGGAGIHVTGSSNGIIKNNQLSRTGADSIHMSNLEGATARIIVSGNQIDNGGDDGVSVVSYRNGHGLNNTIQISGNSVRDQRWGRGYSVVGGEAIVIRDNTYRNNQAGFAGIYIAAESAWKTQGVADVTVVQNLVDHAGGRHGAIHIFADSDEVRRVSISNNTILYAQWVSVMVNGRRNTQDVSITNNVSYSPMNVQFILEPDGAKVHQSGNRIASVEDLPSIMRRQ